MEASPEGLVAVGGELSTANLIAAYARGIFPWPQVGLPMLWFSPDPRGILDFNDFHVGRSLKKFMSQNSQLTITKNRVFPLVIKECQSQVRPGQDGTWITDQVLRAYLKFFEAGHILSVECWDDSQLIAGIYGVMSENYFSAESMFYKKPNASKVCFVHLVQELQRLGHAWMDLQMITEVSAAFGGKYVPKTEFLAKIR